MFGYADARSNSPWDAGMSEIGHSQGAKVAFTARMSPLDFDRLRRLAKEGGWIVAGQVAAVAGSLAAVRLLTEFLTPAQYGELALGLTIAGLVNQVVMGGVCNGIGRFYSIAAEKRDLPGYLSASRRLLGYATLVVLAMAGMLLLGLVWTDRTQWLGLVAAALIFAVLAGYNSCLSGVQNAARQRQIVALHSALDSWLKIALAVGVMLWLGTSSTAVVIGYALSALFVTASQLVFLRRLVRSHEHRPPSELGAPDWAKQILAFGWPTMAGGLFNWLYFASQRWSLELFASTEDVGRFFALTQITVTPISMVGGLAMSFVTPILFARVGDPRDPQNRNRVLSAQRLVFLICIIGAVATIAVAFATVLSHAAIFRIFISSQYHCASVHMPLCIIAGGLLQVSICLSTAIFLTNKTHKLLSINVIGNTIFSLLHAYFTYILGFNGLLYGLVFTACLHLLWIYHIASKSVLELKEKHGN